MTVTVLVVETGMERRLMSSALRRRPRAGRRSVVVALTTGWVATLARLWWRATTTTGPRLLASPATELGTRMCDSVDVGPSHTRLCPRGKRMLPGGRSCLARRPRPRMRPGRMYAPRRWTSGRCQPTAAAGDESSLSIGVTVMSKDPLWARAVGLVAVCVQ